MYACIAVGLLGGAWTLWNSTQPDQADAQNFGQLTASAAQMRRVPLAQATLQDWSEATVYTTPYGTKQGAWVMVLRDDSGLQLVQVSADGRERLWPGWHGFVECKSGVFLADASQRWFAQRPAGKPVLLPNGARIDSCYGDFARGWVSFPQGQGQRAQEGERWFNLDGQEVLRPASFEPPTAAVPVNADMLKRLPPKPVSNFSPWVISPVLEPAERAAHQSGWVRLDVQGKVLNGFGFADENLQWENGFWYQPFANSFRLIDADGRYVTGPSDGFVRHTHQDGLAAAQSLSNNLYGYLDAKGQWAIEPRFNEAGPFANGVAKVQMPATEKQTTPAADLWIDRSGQIVKNAGGAVLTSASAAPDEPELRAINGVWGFADSSGKWLITPRFEDVRPFSNGLAPVKLKDRWGFVDLKGQMVVPAQWGAVTDYQSGIAAAYNTDMPDEKVVWLDALGKPVQFAAPPPVEIRPEKDGLAAARTSGGLWGFVNAQRQWAIAPTYRQVTDFSGNVAGALNLPDSQRTPHCPVKISHQLPNGLLVVTRCYRSALIDAQGHLLVPDTSNRASITPQATALKR